MLSCTLILTHLFYHLLSLLLKKNFIAPFYGWSSTTSRLEPLRGGSLLFTTKSPEIPGSTQYLGLLVFSGHVEISLFFFENFKGCGLDSDVGNGCDVCSSLRVCVVVVIRDWGVTIFLGLRWFSLNIFVPIFSSSAILGTARVMCEGF